MPCEIPGKARQISIGDNAAFHIINNNQEIVGKKVVSFLSSTSEMRVVLPISIVR